MITSYERKALIVEAVEAVNSALLARIVLLETQVADLSKPKAPAKKAKVTADDK